MVCKPTHFLEIGKRVLKNSGIGLTGFGNETRQEVAGCQFANSQYFCAKLLS